MKAGGKPEENKGGNCLSPAARTLVSVCNSVSKISMLGLYIVFFLAAASIYYTP
jgi:hypothetical protein